jgi:hypothetical protein
MTVFVTSLNTQSQAPDIPTPASHCHHRVCGHNQFPIPRSVRPNLPRHPEGPPGSRVLVRHPTGKCPQGRPSTSIPLFFRSSPKFANTSSPHRVHTLSGCPSGGGYCSCWECIPGTFKTPRQHRPGLKSSYPSQIVHKLRIMSTHDENSRVYMRICDEKHPDHISNADLSFGPLTVHVGQFSNLAKSEQSHQQHPTCSKLRSLKSLHLRNGVFFRI